MGPNRVGPPFLGFHFWGLAQPFADVFKLLLKEIVLPENANRFLFMHGAGADPGPGLRGLGRACPSSDTLVLSDINAGLLYILAMTSLGVYGHHHRRLGVQFEVRLPGRTAVRRPDRVLRDSRWASPWWACWWWPAP